MSRILNINTDLIVCFFNFIPPSILTFYHFLIGCINQKARELKPLNEKYKERINFANEITK
jgi:hypothetical protein